MHRPLSINVKGLILLFRTGLWPVLQRKEDLANMALDLD